MRVKSVSLVFQCALKNAGITPQIMPAIIEAMNISGSSSQPGSVLALIISAADAIAPTRICPSAPMFQKRILKAGVRPMATHKSTSASRMVTQVRRGVPIAPSITPIYTLSGLRPVTELITTAHTRSASIIAATRMSAALSG